MVVGRHAAAIEILAATAGTDGSQADILTLEAGGTRLPFDEEVARRGLHHEVVMKGRQVFREAVRRMSQAARETLARAGLELADVDLLVPHQANLRILDAVGRELGLPEDRVFVNLQEYGNTGSASVPLALWEARETGRIGARANVLLVSFGAGFHWAGVLLRFP
jgi:3-oxoacyl-[acyl-carrier-protein] synthase-3